jgi:hypothetical protein
MISDVYYGLFLLGSRQAVSSVFQCRGIEYLRLGHKNSYKHLIPYTVLETMCTTCFNVQ